MDKVEAAPAVINGQLGYDIKINDNDATVQDYIDAIDKFIEESGCYRSRQPELTSCLGCDLCCQERIPVTLVDALKLAEGNLELALKKYLHVYVEDRVVDITMALDEKGRCLLLNQNGLCSDYSKRSLVCHTFVCCPSTKNAKQLREEIVNSGEDELVRNWFKIRNNNGSLIIHDALDPAPELSDYMVTPFAGCKDYDEVKLRDVCSPQLWKKLRGNK